MKGIIFKAESIPLILNGFKTQTRRVIKNPENYDNIRDCDFCARYQVGEVVYIKEAWASDCTCENPKCNGVIYKLGYSGVIVPTKWRSPLFMPEWAARYFIKITGVRAERLQEISLEDCKAEGLSNEPYEDFKVANILKFWQGRFGELWDSINPKYPWVSNPWVFRYKFE